MKAAVYYENGGPDVFKYEDVPDPECHRKGIVLRVEADPSWPYPDGLHHLAIDGTRVYFDAKQTRIDWFARQRR